jgi:hypothetical protein
MCATHGDEMAQTALSCRSEEVVASDLQRRITHAVRAEQLEPVQLARGDHFFLGTPGGRPGGSGPVWAWERPPPRALDGRCPPLRPAAVEDTGTCAEKVNIALQACVGGRVCFRWQR